MTFKYFDRPDVLTSYEPGICGICGAHTDCFDTDAFIGEDSLDAICPDCLKRGALLERDMHSCNGDSAELRRQIAFRYPELNADAVQTIVDTKTAELEKSTPHLVTWQEWNWPCADGDYCQFIGFGSRPLFESLAKSGSAEALFRNSIYYDLEAGSDLDFLWSDVIPETDVEDYESSNMHDTLFYVFRSLHSDTIVTIWDCN